MTDDVRREMPVPEFELLFKPLQVSSMLLPNRVIMPAMHIGMAKDGYPNEGFLDFYEERAKAKPGPGLIIVGGCYPEKRGMGAPNFVALDDDRYIPRLAELTGRLHRYESRVAAQLYHAGAYALSFIIGEQPVAPSAVQSGFSGEMPRELTAGEIAGIQENYALAARRTREAGFDAVELICAAGYIVNQFLSPLTNKRTDRYGGDVYQRMTFMIETITAIKEATGTDFPLVCRLSGSDFVEGSHTNEEARLVAAEMERAGVDLISVTGGWHETRIPQITMNVPRGAYVYLDEGIRDAVKEVPVAACNRINDPVLAERILEERRADLVAMGRAFIADPKILEKSYEGRVDDVRRCIACNQGCFDHVFMLMPITCLVNPRVNRERETELVMAAEKKIVLVAGGGPSGMECAWVAAHRGHSVTLCEETDALGGQGNLACVPPGREEWSEMVRWLIRQCGNEGVEIMTSTEVTPGLIREMSPDVLVLATGAVQLVPPIEGIDGPNVVAAWEVLAGKAETGEEVVVVGGGAVGIETGAYLAERGCRVTVVEMLDRCGTDVGVSTRWTLLQDAAGLGVKFVESCRVERITDVAVVTELRGERKELPCDSVVVAVGSRARDIEGELTEAGVLEGIEVRKIGDCVKPRKALDAIHEGFEAGSSI